MPVSNITTHYVCHLSTNEPIHTVPDVYITKELLVPSGRYERRQEQANEESLFTHAGEFLNLTL